MLRSITVHIPYHDDHGADIGRWRLFLDMETRLATVNYPDYTQYISRRLIFAPNRIRCLFLKH